ncbi:MAG TPA: hypothetical protein VGM56_18065 [Byssovorax sp.]
MTRWLAPALALAALTAACERRGQPYACTCELITDFDDPSHASVEICSPTRERAASFAKGCAQSGAPAKVEACACEPLDAGACDLDRCTQVAR